jgi:hypothetical protein
MKKQDDAICDLASYPSLESLEAPPPDICVARFKGLSMKAKLRMLLHSIIVLPITIRLMILAIQLFVTVASYVLPAIPNDRSLEQVWSIGEFNLWGFAFFIGFAFSVALFIGMCCDPPLEDGKAHASANHDDARGETP